MNTDTRQPESRPLAARRTRRSRRGIALIITLTIMALLLIMATAFVANMRTERLASRVATDQAKSREMAMAGLHSAIAKLDAFFTEANRSNYVIATMPGRFYAMSAWTNGVSVATNMFTAQPSENAERLTILNQRRAVNLNSSSYLWGQQYLPIVNPYGNLKNPAPGDINNVAIWAEWMPVWRSTDAKIEAITQTGGVSTSGRKDGMEGRFAFWVDDESVKINLCNAGKTDLTNGVFAPSTGKSPTYFAAIHPANSKYDTKHSSSVALAALDIPSGANWSSPSTPDDLDKARNPSPSEWRPLRSPEDALGTVNQLTMEDYQKAKFCLTTWSEDVDNFSQIFRALHITPPAAAFPAKRINLAATNNLFTCFVISKQDPKWQVNRNAFFTNIVAHLKSPHLAYFYGGASYEKKYESTPPNTQPLLGGSVEQIAANIISYVSSPEVPAIVTDSAGKIVSPSTAIPTGACGLRKAACMNEIVIGFHWHDTKQKNPIDKSKTFWDLYTAVYVELVNPYDSTDDTINPGGLPRAKPPSYMPTTTPGFPETYSIAFDGNITITGGTDQAAGGDLDGTISGIPALVVQPTEAIMPHTYSQLIPQLVAKNGAIPYKRVSSKSQPAIKDLSITLPQIRLVKADLSGNKSAFPEQILDWFNPKDYPNPNTKVTNPLVLFAGGSSPGPVFSGQPAASTTAPTFTQILSPGNRARISIGKNDPRVHFWTGGPWGDNGSNPNVTVNDGGTKSYGENKNIVINIGDVETIVPPKKVGIVHPEYHSNFVIAERGMASVGELGFIHTGKPFRSLSLQYYKFQPDEKSPPSKAAEIPDWVMMDLFTVNAGPVHGRINVNNAGWQAEADPNDGGWHYNIPVWHTRFQPNLFRPVGGQSLGTGRRVAATGVTPASHTLAAALFFITDIPKRNNLVNYIVRRVPPPPAAATGANPFKPYYTIGELCEVRDMNSWDMSVSSYPNATTDAGREEAIRRISNVLTTRSDVFCVWVVGQAWWEYWRCLGEARLMAIVERYSDTTGNPPLRSKWRIRHLRWVSE
ncbi:MAG: hypothetical protein HZA91_02005 [Verrucomicrobia bacterium]|nr:hypothetical protein [Verrucomicrobiota bacterium]